MLFTHTFIEAPKSNEFVRDYKSRFFLSNKLNKTANAINWITEPLPSIKTVYNDSAQINFDENECEKKKKPESYL